MMSPRAQIPTLSPSNSQSSSSCRSVEVVFSQLSQRQTGKQAQQHSQSARAISISSDEENSPVFIAIDDPTSSSRGKGTGTARGGRARPVRKRVHDAEPADGVPNPQALKAEEEDEEELHVIRFKHHLDSFKAPATSPKSIRPQQRRTEVAAAAPFASSSETSFGPPSQQDARQAAPLDLQRIKGEPSSQAFARSRLVKVESEAAGVQSRSLLTMSSSQNSTRVAHQLPKIEIEDNDSFESEDSRPRRPHDESTAMRPAGMVSAGPIATYDDSITFSDTDADSSVDGQSEAVRERKKPSSNQTPSKAKGKAKAKTPKAAKITKPSQNPRTPGAVKSPKPAAEELPKPKVVKGPKPLPVDVSSTSPIAHWQDRSPLAMSKTYFSRRWCDWSSWRGSNSSRQRRPRLHS
ncbi:hypothetical protein BCV69DRAFT_8714 [Microstroma glucosiphilum]|uniref:Uncharacterized protein n=1 Tax=Pseudomicrostroma glucosiphilum TaxID=1684307 RepID=A0A316UES7_9BASI|nr:hypothetical protein BCV69DRAFT_8714 [Pseudomicrostroma glucosiphilum]PWN23739.1 hypothetical protein BCV69DRAFT_8714 [Pseudomicrostroma glucosiphilum]